MKRILFGLLTSLMFCAGCNNEVVDSSKEDPNFDKESVLQNLYGYWILKESYYIVNEERKQPVDEGDSPYRIKFFESTNGISVFTLEYSPKRSQSNIHHTYCAYLSETEMVFSSFSYVIKDENDHDPVRMKYIFGKDSSGWEILTLKLDMKKDNSVFYRIYRRSSPSWQ